MFRVMDESHDSCGCATRLALSVEEEQILGRMRDLRRQYRELRASTPDDPRLEPLRQAFRACQQELRQANRQKMIRLGHEV